MRGSSDAGGRNSVSCIASGPEQLLARERFERDARHALEDLSDSRIPRSLYTDLVPGANFRSIA
jgi:hypothetical protein